MSSIDFRAYGQNIVVSPIEEETVSPMGLHIVTKEHEKVMFADVLSVGPEVKNGIEEGDTVFFDYWAGAQYKDYVIVPSEVVLGVVAPDAE